MSEWTFGVCLGHTMLLEDADKAIFVQQVKHHHVRFDVDLQYSITWVLWRTLVDLLWMPSGVHMAKVEYLTAL